MILLSLTADKKEPLYLQLYRGIKEMIISGELQDGEKLPSKKDFKEHYQISQNTIEHALSLLIEEGYIYPRERQGYFVADIANVVNIPTQDEDVLEESEDIKYTYNFSYTGVDPHSFPRTIFKRLTREVYEELNDDLLEAGHIQGYTPLRQSICTYLKKSRGVVADSSQIVISGGTEYLFYSIFKLFPDLHYGLENPGYAMLRDLCRTNGVSFTALPLDKQGILLEPLYQANVDIVCVTPSHQFPTGCIMPIGRRRELLQWANGSPGRYIVEDDYDSEFKYNGRPIPALKAIDYEDKVIYMGSFSKSLTPAMRISYMVLPKELLHLYKERLPYFICPVSTLNQKILHTFIAEGYFEKHVNRMRLVYKKKREILVDCLKGTDITVSGADAGLHVVIRFNRHIDGDEFLAECRRQSILIYPLSQYYSGQNHEEQQAYLLGYAAMTKETLLEGAGRLRRLILKYQ